MWFGVIVLAFGAVSSVLGVLYALAEHDIKKLLAYHTVENIGIIMMGVGVGMIGMAIHNPVLAIVGLLGGLYHLLNHAVFKGLLFFGCWFCDVPFTFKRYGFNGRTWQINAIYCFLFLDRYHGNFCITSV